MKRRVILTGLVAATVLALGVAAALMLKRHVEEEWFHWRGAAYPEGHVEWHWNWRIQLYACAVYRDPQGKSHEVGYWQWKSGAWWPSLEEIKDN